MDDIKARIEASEIRIQFDHWYMFVAVDGDIWHSHDLGESWVLYYQTFSEIKKFERIGKWIVIYAGEDDYGLYRFDTQRSDAYIEMINRPILNQMIAEIWMHK